MKRKIFPLLLSLFFALPLGAENLTIYTYASFANPKWGAGHKLKALFETSHPQCAIQYVGIDGSQAMFNRLRLEGKKTKADMVIGLNDFMLPHATQSHLFANAPQLSEKPALFQQTTFVPFGFAQYAFIYDKNRLKNPPKSLQELVQRQDLRIIYPDPRTSVLGQGLVVWFNQTFGENTSQAWKTLAEHTVTITKGWSEAYGAFLKGEADLVLSYHTSPLYHLMNENTDRFVATTFPNGVWQSEYVATLAGRENACTTAFTQFLLTPSAQKILATTNIMLPVISHIGVEAFDTLRQQAENSNVQFWQGSHQQLQSWIKQWQQALVE